MCSSNCYMHSTAEVTLQVSNKPSMQCTPTGSCSIATHMHAEARCKHVMAQGGGVCILQTTIIDGIMQHMGMAQDPNGVQAHRCIGLDQPAVASGVMLQRPREAPCVSGNHMHKVTYVQCMACELHACALSNKGQRSTPSCCDGVT